MLDLPPEWPRGAVGILHITGPDVRDNFVVENYDSDGNQIDLLVNAIGAYEGFLPLDFYDDEETARFQVKAGGPWTIEILPLSNLYFSHALRVPGNYEGVCDDVVFVTGGTPDLAAITSGQERSNFVVRSIAESGVDLLVNEIAPYEGTVILPADTILLIVKAIGAWSIEVSAR